MASQNVYKVDLREINFLLWEYLDIEKTILSDVADTDFNRPLVEDILNAARDFAYTNLGPAYQESDREGCGIEDDGKIRLPGSFPPLWKEFCRAQWGRLAVPQAYGGMGAPYLISQAVNEMFLGSNPSFMTYSGFCVPALYLIELFGDERLKSIFCEKLAENRWSACFCMTEPDAGTDVGNIRTKAIPKEDNTYEIEGSKIFISAGMHDLTENIVYIVVARLAGAIEGTMGLSCFIVPRFRAGCESSGNEDNHVRCVGLEDKMGLHGCVTAQLTFGEDGPCKGYLLGEKENIGLRQLLYLMNEARITTGIYALGMASSAYLNAADYARNRIQGTDFRQSFNPRAAKVPIIKHLDVRRMLLEMKSKVEGCRALIYKLAYHYSMNQFLRARTDDVDKQEIAIHEGIVNLLTPIAKAYISDQAWRIAELSIQVYGGYGYTKDYPVEQYARDIKILSIWEGTNFIQSADLIREKIGMGRSSRLFDIFVKEIRGFLDQEKKCPFPSELKVLARSLEVLVQTHALMGRWVKEKKIELIFAVSTRFLEMMAEVCIGWLLLESAAVASRAIGKIDEGDPDYSFYKGKIISTRFFINNILPDVFSKAEILESEDMSIMESDQSIFN